MDSAEGEILGQGAQQCHYQWLVSGPTRGRGLLGSKGAEEGEAGLKRKGESKSGDCGDSEGPGAGRQAPAPGLVAVVVTK
jgi:hypothetical protein